MNLIKLPTSLGLMVVEILKKQNIMPRTVDNGTFRGMLSLEFSQEELDLVKEINIINPSHSCLDGIENLHCLERLSITTTGSTAYQKSPASIDDKDIAKIAKIKSLKFLKIDNQSKISWVYLDHLENLEYIQLTRNTALNEIFGLNKLHKVKEFTEYGNKELFNLNGISELIEQNELDVFEADFLHYDEVIECSNKLTQMINCDFQETLRSSNKTVTYSFYQMLLFHKKCLEIANAAQKFSHDKKTQIIYIENYLARNISYDYDALNTQNRVHYQDGKQKGKSYGTNSAYNGIMFGSAVCEGYTRTMQYILKLMGIKTKNVHCIGGSNKISIDQSYHNKVTLPSDGYHSIIRIDSQDSIYYCDPCWDSCRFHNGDSTLPYCLLTKKEILQSHTLSFEEDEVIYDISYPRNFVLSVIKYLNENEKFNLSEDNNKKR